MIFYNFNTLFQISDNNNKSYRIKINTMKLKS